MLAARWTSIVAHPFVTATALVAGVESRRAGSAAATHAVGAVATLVVLPLAVLTAWKVRRGAWTTVDASEPRDRPALFLVAMVGLLVLLGYFTLVHRDTTLAAGTSVALAMSAVCAAVTPWIKLSLHLAVAALAATVLLTIGSRVAWPIALAIGPLAWSRVALARHRWPEVALGALVGACTGVVAVRLR